MAVATYSLFTIHISHSKQRIFVGILAYKDEKEQGESQQRRAAIAEEGQRDSDDRHKAQHHADVYKDMEKQYGGYTIAIETRQLRPLSLGHSDEVDQQTYVGRH